MKGECIMKRIKPYVFAVLVIMTVMCLSACGSNKNTTNETTGGSSAATTQTTAMESTTDMGTTRTVSYTHLDVYKRQSRNVPAKVKKLERQ